MAEVLQSIYYYCNIFSDIVLSVSALLIVATISALVTFVVLSFTVRRAWRNFNRHSMCWDMNMDAIEASTRSLRSYYGITEMAVTHSVVGDDVGSILIEHSNAKKTVFYGDWLRDFLWYNNALGLTIHIRPREESDLGDTKEEQEATRQRMYDEMRTFMGTYQDKPYEKYENDVNSRLLYYNLNKF